MAKSFGTSRKRGGVILLFVTVILAFPITFFVLGPGAGNLKSLSWPLRDHDTAWKDPTPTTSFIFTTDSLNRLISDECTARSETAQKRQRRDSDQADPCILEFIKRHFLLAPPPVDRGYTFSRGSSDHVNDHSRFVANYFKNKTNGVFLEVGAHDGVQWSSTLYLELKLGWTGLLIDCNSITLPSLRSRNRKAWIAQTCLSTTDTPEAVDFWTLKDWPASAQLDKPLSDAEMKVWGLNSLNDTTWYNYSLPAFPLYSIVMATRAFDHIDFLGLDVQGIELEVLRNFPFGKFNVQLIIAEVALFSPTKKMELKRLMREEGYTFLKNEGNGYDYFFSRDPNLV